MGILAVIQSSVFGPNLILENSGIASSRPKNTATDFASAVSDKEQIKKFDTQLLNNALPLSKRVTFAKQRKQKMLQLIKKDPKAFLELALPGETRNRLPPGIKLYIEQSIRKQGTFEVWHEDDFENKKYKQRYFLKEKTGRSELFFAMGEPKTNSGSEVVLSGYALDNQVILANADQVLGIAGAEVDRTQIPTTGEQKIAVILVAFSDGPTPTVSPEEIHDRIFGLTNADSVDSYYKEVSYGKTWLTGNVFGWYQGGDTPSDIIHIETSGDVEVCSSHGLLQRALEVADADIFYPDYQRIAVIVSTGVSCGLGFALGSSFINTQDGSSTLTSVLLIAEYRFDDVFYNVFIHEFGHNLGLPHSSSLECGDVSFSHSPNACSVFEYGDYFDIMGGLDGHFNSIQKETLGWFNSGNIVDVTQDAIIALTPLERAGLNTKVLKIPCGARQDYTFYLEFRQPLGKDAIYGGEKYDINGPMAHKKLSDYDFSSPILLDMTPHSNPRTNDKWDWLKPIIPTGQTVIAPFNDVGITNLKTNLEETQVKIDFPPYSPLSCGNNVCEPYENLANCELDCNRFRVFVSSTQFSGNLGGTRGADFQCQILADNANLGGRWKAYLGTSAMEPGNGIAETPFPYQLLDGTRIANDWNDLTDGTIRHPINLDETKTLVNSFVWTGKKPLRPSNRLTPTLGALLTCQDWTFDQHSATVKGASGIIDGTNTIEWERTKRSLSDCSTRQRIYCIEQPSDRTFETKTIDVGSMIFLTGKGIFEGQTMKMKLVSINSNSDNRPSAVFELLDTSNIVIGSQTVNPQTVINFQNAQIKPAIKENLYLKSINQFRRSGSLPVALVVLENPSSIDRVQAICGNGLIEPGEQCEGNKLNGKTCGNFCWDRGLLGCNSNCLFDFSGCCSDFAYKSCYNGNVYWFDSCGNPSSLYTGCGGRSCRGDSCRF